MPERLYCRRCGEVTDHLYISEGKVYICSVLGCGHEIRTNKKENTMAYKRLDERETAELRGKWAALPEAERNDAAIEKLASEYGICKDTVTKKIKNPTDVKPTARKKARKATRKVAGSAAAKKSAGPAVAENIAAAVNRYTDERLEEQRKRFEAAWAEGIAKLAKALPSILEEYLVKPGK